MLRNLFAKAVAISMIFASLFCVGLSAQNKPISGTVTDAQGVPVIGAAVYVVGNTSTGVMTDVDGKYTLSVPANSSIAVSCIGYALQTVQIGSESVYNVMLQEDTELLEETVVVGYGVQRKSDLTGSVASVREDDLQNRSTSDAAAALQGKAAGVQILNTSGAPGSSASIRVRGYSSNSGNLGPLLIVDGLKVSNISYLDPSMIASMEVLKDGASAAIYGAEAGNGVVLITTKTGEKGKASITYEGKFTLQTLAKQADLLDGPTYVDYQYAIGQMDDETLAGLGISKDNIPDYNWFDASFAPAWSQQHGLTLRGGNTRGNYLTSLNFIDNDGIVKGDKDTYQRITAQINADYKLFDWFQVGTNTSFESYKRKSVSTGYGSVLNAVMSLDPLTPAYYSTIEECTPDMRAHYEQGYNILRDPTHNNDFYATSKYLVDASANPLLRRDLSDGESQNINIRGTLYGNLTPFKGLTITSRFGYRIGMSSSHSYSFPYYANTMASSDQYSISASVNNNFYYQWENFANYNRTFGKHNVSAMVGMSYINSTSDGASISASGEDILSSYEPNFRYIAYLKDDIKPQVSNSPSRSASLSYFGRLGYSYDNRYSVQANFRADAFDSSKLHANNRWGYFPSASFGWTISNESFVKDNVDKSVMSFLKLRASWGRNGNVNILNGYPYAATIDLNSQWYQYDPSNGSNLTYGSGPTDMPNENLRWETSEQYDLGLDARFLSDRLSVTVDWYRKLTRDLLLNFTPLPEIGVKSSVGNAGNVLNTGLEFELGWKDTVGDFQYGINANLATLHNEVLSLHESVPRLLSGGVSGLNNTIQTAFEPGYTIWYIRGYKYAGVDTETGAPTYYNKDGEIVTNVSEDDLQEIGQTIPSLTYGLTLNLAYKGFDMVVFGTGAAGSEIVSLLYNADRPRTNTLTHYWENSWKQPGDNTRYPNMKTVAQDWKFWSSSASVYSGNFFKIKQIQLGYTLPRKLTQKFLVNNFRVYASFDDFITFSKYPGMDPETAANSGFDAGTYPTMRKLVLGVNITF